MSKRSRRTTNSRKGLQIGTAKALPLVNAAARLTKPISAPAAAKKQSAQETAALCASSWSRPAQDENGSLG